MYLHKDLFAVMYPRSENIKKNWLSSQCDITVCLQTYNLVNSDSEQVQCLGETYRLHHQGKKSNPALKV
jgi:hypothetical protein